MLGIIGASLVAQMVKNLPAMRETWVRAQGWEDPLGKRMATHSMSIIASSGCPNIVPCFGWLDITEMYTLTILKAAAAAAKSLQSCPTLWDPRDDSPPGSPVPGILQARTLEWVAISFSNAWKWKVKVKSLSRVRLLVTPWTAAYQAPPSMGFWRLEVQNQGVSKAMLPLRVWVESFLASS